MPGSDDNKRQHTISEMQNWNLDRTVDAPVMLRGMMGRDATGVWRYILVDSSGHLVITGSSVGGFTPGSVIFAGAAGTLTEDNPNFFWDDTNNRLGIGINTPAADLDIYRATGAAVFAQLKSGSAGVGLRLDKFAVTNDTNIQYLTAGVEKWKQGMFNSNGVGLGSNWSIINVAIGLTDVAFTIDVTDHIGIGGMNTPTARLHLPAGLVTATFAPLKFTTGTALGTPEDGAVEYDTSHLWFTIGSTRYQLDQQPGAAPHPLLDGTYNSDTLAGSVVLGDLIYGNATPKWQRLGGNTTTTKKFLTQTGDGAISAAPGWNTIVAGDLPGGFNGFANPTASVGLTAVNGSAVTAMRSDAAPPIDQAIIPTWTGLHTFNKAGITTTLVTAVAIVNTTASTSGVTVQNSPGLLFTGHAWSSGFGVDTPVSFRNYLLPVTAAAASGTLVWYYENNSANVMTLTGAGVLSTLGAVTPITDDGASLGTTALEWSDLFLATGGVINWANGNATLTHATGSLTFNGVPVTAPVNGNLASTSTSITFDSTYYGKYFLWSPSGTATATLPANGATAGAWFEVYLLTNQTITISAATADTLITVNDTQADSVAFSTLNLKTGSCVRFVSNGTVWIAVNVGSTTMTVAT